MKITVYDGAETIGGNKIHVEENGRGIFLDFGMNFAKYVINQYNKALRSEKKRNVAFALIILQRRMASSVYALKRSLERRKRGLEEYLRDGIEKEVRPTDIEEIEDYEEEERWRIEQDWEALRLENGCLIEVMHHGLKVTRQSSNLSLLVKENLSWFRILIRDSQSGDTLNLEGVI